MKLSFPRTDFANIASVGTVMRIRKQFLAFVLFLQPAQTLAQPAPRPIIGAAEAKSLAELMCRQLPNIGTILENTVQISSTVPSAPPQEATVTDDVGDALLQLGPYSINCLTVKLLDARWMPDPRSEPLLGTPVVGDVAYMILGDKGVPDFLPQLAHKKPNDLRMDDYFIWPSIADHRKRLHDAVREWIVKHPNCCGTLPILRPTAPTTVNFRMSKSDIEKARSKFSLLRVGMTPRQVLKIAGKPDAIDPGNDDNPDHWHTDLLGICANDHNERLAYIYFTERWTDEIARRNPLRDRYVIVFFSGEGKLTRMFSNVAAIAPILPPNSYRIWLRLICNTCKTG
jgi:hypothetical protein